MHRTDESTSSKTMTTQYITEAYSMIKMGQIWRFHCNYCGSTHTLKTGLNIHLTKVHPLLKRFALEDQPLSQTNTLK